MSLTNNDERIINQIKDRLTSEGITIGPIIIRAIIGEYLIAKRDVILQGESFSEDGIGTIHPNWRRVPSGFSEKKFTSLLKCEVEPSLKDAMNHNLVNDLHYARKLDAVDLYDEFSR